MAFNPAYSAVFVSGRRTVEVVERSVTEDERRLDVWIDGKCRGEVWLQLWWLPGIAISDYELFIWGGTSAFFLNFDAGELRQSDFDFEINHAYRLPTLWCVICELSIVLWAPEEMVNVAECFHEEVLLGSWWDGDRLFVEDFQKRCFEVKIDERGPSVDLVLTT